MSRRQVDACAARLDPGDAARFRALIEASNAIFMQALALRRQAWALYREATGLTVRGRVAKS